MDPFIYSLPPDRIAQRPVYPYDMAKLLVVNRSTGEIQERRYIDFPKFVEEPDLLIFNNTRVMPFRLFGTHSSRNIPIEILLIKETQRDIWRAIGRPLKKLIEDDEIIFTDDLRAKVLPRDSLTEVSLGFSTSQGSVYAKILSEGVMPVPPYIRDGRGDNDDRRDYQTYFASVDGSIAAPTASLHFTEELVGKIRMKGCTVSYLTLHVGPPSFLPLWKEGDASSMTRPGREEYIYSSELLDQIRHTKLHGGRIFAIGTTVTRALESMIRIDEPPESGAALETELFISPGFSFNGVDCLGTNFHQPKTSHLLLVEAFMGKQLLKECYDLALKHDFRFLSYGDGMLVL